MKILLPFCFLCCIGYVSAGWGGDWLYPNGEPKWEQNQTFKVLRLCYPGLTWNLPAEDGVGVHWYGAGGISQLTDIYNYFKMPPLEFIANLSQFEPAGNNHFAVETIAIGTADVDMEYYFVTQSRIQEISYGYPYTGLSGYFIFASKVILSDSRCKI